MPHGLCSVAAAEGLYGMYPAAEPALDPLGT